MRKYLFSLVFAAAGLCLTGCQSTPGFRLAWEFSLPPTLKTSTTLAPVPVPAQTMYLADGGSDAASLQRQIQVVPLQRRLVPAPAPAPQQLPMPRQTLPPCQSSGAEAQPGTTQE